MNVKTEKIKPLLSKVHTIVKQQKEIEVVKGENFNIFSILKMEAKENATHSAFLGELLNPKGTHSKGDAFLKLFLETVNYSSKVKEAKDEKKQLMIKSASVKLEHDLGGIVKESKTGGRIDIYIGDDKGNTISIENKIYAKDQEAQVERYCNHNTKKNTVYYLTLKGKDASEKSRGKLVEGKDYYSISYKNDIVNWLEHCLKEAADHPILRESIKQYLILIKKLTNQLNNHTMTKEVKAIIMENYAEAKVIEGNVWKVELQTTKHFLVEVKLAIELQLKNGWTIEVSDNLNASWTGMSISHSTWNGAIVKLEGASKVPWSNSNYGIHADNKVINSSSITNNCSEIEVLQHGFKSSDYWPYYKTILWLSKDENRLKLFDVKERKHLVEVVGNKLIALAKACEIPLSKSTKVV